MSLIQLYRLRRQLLTKKPS